jgi:hypothetical protein
MFAWYITYVKNPKGGVTHQMIDVLHYRLENRPPPTPEPVASVPEPVRQPTPATLRYNDGELYKCENCGSLTLNKFNVVPELNDINVHNDFKPHYVSMCGIQCCLDYQKWCRSLIPGLNSRPKGYPNNLIHVTFNGIYVPGDGDALHKDWCVQFILVKKGRRTGMIITPYGDKTVMWDGERLTPSIHVSLNMLRKWYPDPTH